MLAQLADQVLVLLAAAVLLGVPGAALTSLLRVRAALPDTLAVPTAALLGSLVACAATGLQLATSSPVEVGVGTHTLLSVALAGAALLVRRGRRRRGAEVVPLARGWSLATTVVVVVGALFAWLVRGVVRLDGLYHVAVSRKLVELSEPTFSNVNRFADGGPNPVYALPGWHAFVGWTGWTTGVDPIIAWEVMPVLVVALGALAAAGLARVLLSTPRAEAVGALAWVLARVLFARREVDGDAIAYGAVPGQVTFELALPVILAAVVIALTVVDRAARRGALVAIATGIVATVVYHANYLPYVAITGLGYGLWWMLAARRTEARLHDGRRLLVVGAQVAGIAVLCSAIVLPLLATLENFGNAPEGDRIDYHLTETLGMAHVRGGHAYEMLGLPGLVGLLAVPLLAWRLRRRATAFGVVSGGVLALLAFSFLPPLFQLLRATGSLTLLLRINHAIGVLLVVALAGLVLEVADAVAARGWSHRRRQLWGAVAVAVFVAFGVAMGYDRFSPDLPGYLAWVALLVVLVVLAVRRVGVPHVDAAERPRACRGLVASVALVLTLGLALPVGAISIKRAVTNMDEFGVGVAQGDLICLGGPVADELQEVEAGSLVLSDPIASFRAMALAPVYVVGDYKVWNAATSDNRAEERLASVNRFFDSSVDDEERLAILEEQGVEYLLVDVQDSRWLDERWADEPATRTLDRAWGELDRFADVQAYDGGGIARLVQRNPERFELLASDERGRTAEMPPPTPDVETPCQSYALWRVRTTRGGGSA